jgi:predicted Zn-dependent protease
MPERPDAFSLRPAPGPGPTSGPGNAVTILIIGLSAALLVAIVMLWRSGTAGPQEASGATPLRDKPAASESVAALLGAARSYADQQDFPKAEAILRAAVREHAEDQELRIAFGETLMRERKFGEAYDQYAKALDIGPREPKVEFVAGTLASQTGRLDEAVTHYSAARQGDPGNAQYPLYLAQVQIKQDHVEEAKTNLLFSIKLDPQNAVAWGTLADIFLRQNKLDIALKNIAEARKLQPEVTLWKLVEARARARKGDPQKALLLLSTLDRSEQRGKDVLDLVSQCYGMLKRPADAARVYADASDAAPTDADVAYQAAVWAQKAGDSDAARRYASRAAKQGHAGARALEAKLKSP